MICQNAILSDEYMDYIWKADVNPPAEMDPLPYGVCAQYISPSFSVYYISRKEVFGNRTSLPIGIMHCLGAIHSSIQRVLKRQRFCRCRISLH